MFLVLGRTVSQYFYKVLQALIFIHTKYIKLFFNIYIMDCCITKDTKYELYFRDYLGVLDKTHISIFVFYENYIAYWNQKGFLS